MIGRFYVIELGLMLIAAVSFILGLVLIVGGFLLNGRIMALFVGATNIVIAVSFFYALLASLEGAR